MSICGVLTFCHYVRLWLIDVQSLCPFVVCWHSVIMSVCGWLTCSRYVRLWLSDMLSLCPFVVDWHAVVMSVCGWVTCCHYGCEYLHVTDMTVCCKQKCTSNVATANGRSPCHMTVLPVEYDSSYNCSHMMSDRCNWLCTLYSVSTKDSLLLLA